MNIVVVDTNILIDYIHGFAPWLKLLLHKRQEFTLVVPTIVTAEYLTAEENEDQNYRIRTKGYLKLFKIQDLTYEISEILGDILRRKTYLKGAGIGDLIIASTTLYFAGELATRNQKDFAKIPNLRFFDPNTL
ncbi:hypothetical protein A2773_06385 [Candidatus Gottesmanbacteria bacterium RIFCSPHIGHO2_01_FULL_39_10]|uniref:PIN domain-containing protein n=1 Tax=Candidatus Gottesmanbacteria bacterium RIFCSPHIGHO2_01_FULL_39_10 TaxID=1798375 RepID=A0A1F5ZQ33_9BACT|nr:MAG: hypothetical protein A2773_06385 [Candidatus Gottesmanbacteria bacterium RIFCSPHIGHO2_01_FULL_39_10]